jgi:hypothetical protein
MKRSPIVGEESEDSVDILVLDLRSSINRTLHQSFWYGSRYVEYFVRKGVATNEGHPPSFAIAKGRNLWSESDHSRLLISQIGWPLAFICCDPGLLSV